MSQSPTALRALQPILDAVRLACELSRRVLATQPQTHRKADASPVSLADYGAQALLCRALLHAFPGDGVLAEESAAGFLTLPQAERELGARLVGKLLGQGVGEGDLVRWLDHGRGARSARTWVIDPIDGTEGYLHGRAYAICIGTLVGGEPLEGFIGVPVSPLDADGTLFFTEGGRAWAQSLEEGEPRVLHVSDRADPASLRAVESYVMGRRSREVADQVYAAAGVDARRVKRYDSMLKYALVAAGTADVFIRGPRDPQTDPHKTWDHVAGTALVRAAGGRVTGLEGEPVDFSRGAELRGNRGLIVTNGRVQEHLVAAMARVTGR